MKAIVVYSSQTGNTKKLAEAVCQALPSGTMMYDVDKAPDPSGYDFVALGFWLQAGQPDPKSKTYLERLRGHKCIFLFASHGASPDSEHARNAMAQASSLAVGATVAGSFNCYGEVNPKVLEKVKAKQQPPVWLPDSANAVGHPNTIDLENLNQSLADALPST